MYMYQTGGRDPEILMSDMRFMGYDSTLKLSIGQTLILSAHRSVISTVHCFD